MLDCQPPAKPVAIWRAALTASGNASWLKMDGSLFKSQQEKHHWDLCQYLDERLSPKNGCIMVHPKLGYPKIPWAIIFPVVEWLLVGVSPIREQSHTTPSQSWSMALAEPQTWPLLHTSRMPRCGTRHRLPAH